MNDQQSAGDGVAERRPVPLARVLAGEIAVGTAVNIAFNLFFAWLVFYGRTPVGRDSILLDLVPAAFLPAFLMTFPVTVLIRKRIAKGLRVTPETRLPIGLPEGLLPRSAAIALVALALTAVPAIVVVDLCWGADWNWRTVVLFKIAFSAFHAAIMTPIAVTAALTLDRRV